MMNCNWMVTLANAQRKALINIGYPVQQVSNMSLADTTKELKSIGYDFKANSPLKNIIKLGLWPHVCPYGSFKETP